MLIKNQNLKTLYDLIVTNLPRSPINLQGKIFSKLTVSEYLYSKPKQGAYWKCICLCGGTIVVCATNLLQERVKSCGCLSAGMPLGKVVSHGFSSIISSHNQKRFGNIWDNMKQRCLNPKNDNYPNYGGRGIKICKRWMKFENFIKDMWKSYIKHIEEFGEKNTTLGRIEVEGNYKNLRPWWGIDNFSKIR